jgi:hypothetical protein
MTMINCTPHPINIVGPEGAQTVEPSGVVIRVSQTRSEVCTIQTEVGHIRVMRSVPGEVNAVDQEGNSVPVPERRAGTFIIVSGMVVAAAPHRGDFINPGEVTRDDKGRITGCIDFSCF